MKIVGDALPRRGNRLSKLVATSLMSIFGWQIEADIPNYPKLVLIGAPHTSNVDFLLTLGTLFSLGIRISWMAKHTLFRWPFERLLKWLGGIPINRTVRNSGIVAQTIDAFSRHDKLIVAIMPEGTRSKVKKWKTGFYHIALGAKIPIVLIRFDYARKVIGIGPTIHPTGDQAAEMTFIKSIFASIKGKNPRQFDSEKIEASPDQQKTQ